MFIVITALTALILIAAVGHTMWTHNPRINRARRMRNLGHEHAMLIAFDRGDYSKARKAMHAHKGIWYTPEAAHIALVLTKATTYKATERLTLAAAYSVTLESMRLRSL